MLQSQKMKCLVLSRYPYSDPQVILDCTEQNDQMSNWIALTALQVELLCVLLSLDHFCIETRNVALHFLAVLDFFQLKMTRE